MLKQWHTKRVSLRKLHTSSEIDWSIISCLCCRVFPGLWTTGDRVFICRSKNDVCMEHLRCPSILFVFFIFLFLGRRVGKSCAVVATRPNSFTLGSCSNSPKLVILLALRENKTCKDHESERFEEFVEFKRWTPWYKCLFFHKSWRVTTLSNVNKGASF